MFAACRFAVRLTLHVVQVEDIDLEDDKQAYEAIETRNMIGDVIIKKAQEFDSSAVVMSSHSKGPIAEFFLGSVTSYCSQHCSKPVSQPLVHEVSVWVVISFMDFCVTCQL